LETNTKIPAAWIGRAYAIALKDKDKFNDELISDYIEKGTALIAKSDKQLKDDASAIGMSLYLDHYSNTIGTTVETSVKARVESQKAAAAASNALMGAIVGGAIGASSKNTLFKTVGYGAAGVGAVSSVSKADSSKKLSAIGEGVFGTAIKIVLLSIPVVQIVFNSSKNASKVITKKLTSSLEEWQLVVSYLFFEQANRIDTLADDIILKLKKPKEAIMLLNKPNDIEEIRNLIILADEVGLDNHKSFEILKSVEDEIKLIGEKDDMIKNIEKFKGLRVSYWIGYGVFMAFAFIIVGFSVDLSLLCFIGAGICVGFALFSRSETQKKLIEVFKTLKSNKSVFANVKPKDIDFEELGL